MILVYRFMKMWGKVLTVASRSTPLALELQRYGEFLGNKFVVLSK